MLANAIKALLIASVGVAAFAPAFVAAGEAASHAAVSTTFTDQTISASESFDVTSDGQWTFDNCTFLGNLTFNFATPDAKPIKNATILIQNSAVLINSSASSSAPWNRLDWSPPLPSPSVATLTSTALC